MTIEEISKDNVSDLAQLILYLWPQCDYKEEFQNGLKILNSETETAFIAKKNGIYMGFIQLSLRSEFVEGTSTSPVLYMEGIYVDPGYRKIGVAQKLVDAAEEWGKKRGCKEMASDAELPNQTSIEFHKAVGFEEVNRLMVFRKDL
ncbi:MAG: GNAT family N-acetyltransferase [Ekhidna sp.]|uniref:aminoglycoside 6'-N-acetyltransferase n=1 Tax=Ekhidna sp. TaxID=2608089 RepID=UPI0032F05654